MKYKKSGILLSVSLLIFFMAVAFSPAPQQAKEGFKNLKILPKDISKKKLDSTMDYYSLSLGVRCGFCHARNADTSNHHLDFASDAKDEKNIARHMMQMTSYLNNTYFNENASAKVNTDYMAKPDTIHVVTCFTCHRGSKEASAESLLPQLDTLKAVQRRKYEKSRK